MTKDDLTMKVSVIMPAFNAALYIEESLDSVLMQTYLNWEVIVVDDCSSDGTGEILSSYSKKYPNIKYIKLDKNQGAAVARNVAIENATGDLIAILDSDDIWLPNKLEKQVEVFEKNEEIGLCGTGTEVFGKHNYSFIYPETNNEVIMRLLLTAPFSHSSVMIRKSMLDKTGVIYNKNYTPTEDYKLYTDLYGNCEFYNIPDILLKYRTHSDNISVTQNKLQTENKRRVQGEIIKKVFKNSSFTDREISIHLLLLGPFNRGEMNWKEITSWIKKLQSINTVYSKSILEVYKKNLFTLATINRMSFSLFWFKGVKTLFKYSDQNATRIMRLLLITILRVPYRTAA